ncbi:MAG: RDD family protein [Polyangiaceae bacterium]|nr:RDD family protein [Polyangiaceae bacterium]
MPIAPMDADVAVESPEHIVFRYRIAGPARRCVAHVIDWFVYSTALAVLVLVMIFAMAGARGQGVSGFVAEASGGLLLVAVFATQWLYFVAWEATLGRSPGKMVVGLRVVTTEGRPIGLKAAALRNFLRAADALPTAYIAGVICMAMTSRFQRLGDLVAATMVVVPEHAAKAAALDLVPPAYPHELATLPEDISLDEDERAAIELFLRRRRGLGPARANELAAMIAGPIGERIGFRHPDPARLLALVYDRAVNAGRTDAPASLRSFSLPPPPPMQQAR